MDLLHIKCKCKCKCGRDEKLTEQQADNLAWQEHETLKCDCGKSLPNKGHGKIKNFGFAWTSES